ncbi:InlB B-repeat-containing protein [Hymenobacter sp. HDW8]|uniref:InlB B-repeat-containing protein n=1 Tax=Hymenobacter sp. HDW8 TaxID=2714932 RepID=UPI00140AB255|nr:malectin domain-containing carbohydrate-binding protein [Hymenobacter sp. HDW8]QIL75328.1 hypothetical protein G7064_05300 [Hymenobacter sp. HDW8]
MVHALGTFAADNFFAPAAGTTTSTFSTSAAIAGGAIYQTERSGKNFGYSFPVSSGKQYRVVLHLAEIYFTQANKRVFDVKLEGTRVLDNYDIFAKVGANTATTETFTVTVADDALNLDFSSLTADGGLNNAKIAALEVYAVDAPATTYTLTTTASPAAGGTVGRSPNAGSYASGTVVSLTATPAAGYVFSGWSGDATGTVNPLSVTMSANKSITATFTVAPPVSYTLTTTTSPTGGGTISRTPNAASYASGTVVSLTATPEAGYTFSGWSGDASGSTNPLSVTMSANKNITATFTQTPPTTYTLTTTASPTAGGTIGRVPNAGSYASGTVVSLTATPAAGYVFSGWSGDATGTTNPLSVTMSANKSITATFTATSGGQQVVSFILINAVTDQPIRELVAGEVLNLATLPTTSLNILAVTSPSTVGSVRFVLSGAQARTQTETGQPYALFGDTNGNYASWTPPVGSYSLTATPYTGSNAGGTAGTPLTLPFSVVNQSALRTASVSSAQKDSGLSFSSTLNKVYPNPSPDGRFNVELSEPFQGDVSYTLVSSTGAKVSSGTIYIPTATTVLTLDFSNQMNTVGEYQLHLRGAKSQAKLKLMRK